MVAGCVNSPEAPRIWAVCWTVYAEPAFQMILVLLLRKIVLVPRFLDRYMGLASLGNSVLG